jgi:hypothetical protein
MKRQELNNPSMIYYLFPVKPEKMERASNNGLCMQVGSGSFGDQTMQLKQTNSSATKQIRMMWNSNGRKKG